MTQSSSSSSSNNHRYLIGSKTIKEKLQRTIKRRVFIAKDDSSPSGTPIKQDDSTSPKNTITGDGSSFSYDNFITAERSLALRNVVMGENLIKEESFFVPGNTTGEDGKPRLCLDNKKFNNSVVIEDNNSMFFHEITDDDDDFSTFQYSLRAPSFLSPPRPVLRLNSTEMEAQKNISQYFNNTPAVVEGNGEETHKIETKAGKRRVVGLMKKDNIFGSMVLMPEEHSVPSSRKVGTPTSLHKDRREYTNKLMGIEDSRERLGSKDLETDDTEYSEPAKKKLWFGRRGLKKRGDNKDTAVLEKRTSPVLVSPLSRKAPLKKSESASRRGSF